jgi:hypothetical protein
MRSLVVAPVDLLVPTPTAGALFPEGREGPSDAGFLHAPNRAGVVSGVNAFGVDARSQYAAFPILHADVDNSCLQWSRRRVEFALRRWFRRFFHLIGIIEVTFFDIIDVLARFIMARRSRAVEIPAESGHRFKASLKGCGGVGVKGIPPRAAEIAGDQPATTMLTRYTPWGDE